MEDMRVTLVSIAKLEPAGGTPFFVPELISAIPFMVNRYAFLWNEKTVAIQKSG